MRIIGIRQQCIADHSRVKERDLMKYMALAKSNEQWTTDNGLMSTLDFQGLPSLPDPILPRF
jgi:hypothetical protein